MKTEIQSKVLNLFLGLSKVPFTDQGIALVQNAVIDALEEGVRAGGIVQEASSEDGEATQSYTVTVPVRPIWMQLPARAANLPV